MTTLDGLRRASLVDIDAVVALQRAAYEKNRGLLGVEPLPLLADYADVLRDYEVWLAENADGLEGVLILEPRADDLLVWSIACAPAAQRQGLGRRLLAAANARALALGRRMVRLYTGEPLVDNIAWYRRRGFAIERVEQLPGRRLVHMAKGVGDA